MKICNRGDKKHFSKGSRRAASGERGNRERLLKDIYRGCPPNSVLTAAAGRTEREEDAR